MLSLICIWNLKYVIWNRFFHSLSVDPNADTDGDGDRTSEELEKVEAIGGHGGD